MESERTKKAATFLKAIAFCALFCLLFVTVTEILKDKRMEGEYNPTTKVRGFYKEPKDTIDFIFLGSSQVYADIAPAVLYRDYGMTSYDFCANEQPLWITYYYLKEALKRQKPKAVILDVFTVYGADYEEEGVNHINLDDLPMNLNKILAIRNGVPKELRYSYYFEIAKYHSTWEGMDQAKFEATFKRGKDPMKGYSPFLTDQTYEESAKEEVVGQKECEEIPARAQEWLIKIIQLAREKNVELLLLKTPNGNADRQRLYNSVEKLAKEQGVPFLNLNTVLDGEAHINVLQAEKVTQTVGQYLNDNYTFTDKRGDAEYGDWEESVELFERYKLACAMLYEKEPQEYLDFLAKQSGYDYMLSINGEDTGKETVTDSDKKVLESLKKIGFDLQAAKEEGMIALAESGGVTEQKQGTEAPAISKELDGRLFQLKLEKDDDTKKARLRIDGIQYNIATSGIQLVVYDTILHKAVDAVVLGEKVER